MKFKLCMAALALLLINGCDSSSTSASGSTEDALVKEEVGSDNPNIDEPATKVVVGWYMRTVVKATASDGTEYIHKTAGVMGEFKESQDGKDRHDIDAYGAPALSVLFIQNEWGEDNGNYFSDYRAYSSNDNRQVWTIQVKNNTGAANLTNAPLTLTLEGAYSIYEEDDEGRIKYKEELLIDQSKKQMMVLVDVDHQREYTYEELQSAELDMDGLEIRTFRWVLGTVEPSDYEPLSVSGAEKVSISAKSAKASVALDPDDKFGRPPSF